MPKARGRLVGKWKARKMVLRDTVHSDLGGGDRAYRTCVCSLMDIVSKKYYGQISLLFLTEALQAQSFGKLVFSADLCYNEVGDENG